MAALKPKYKIPEVLQTISKMKGNRTIIEVGKHYHSAKGDFYFYVTSHGYYHALKGREVKHNGKILYLEIVDYLLTSNNMIKEIRSYGSFKDIDELIYAIENSTN